METHFKEGSFVFLTGEFNGISENLVTERIGIIRRKDELIEVEFCWGKHEVDPQRLVALAIDGKMTRREITREYIYRILRHHHVEVIASLAHALGLVMTQCMKE